MELRSLSTSRHLDIYMDVGGYREPTFIWTSVERISDVTHLDIGCETPFHPKLGFAILGKLVPTPVPRFCSSIYAVMSQEREKGRVTLLQMANGVSAVFLDLQGGCCGLQGFCALKGSLRDEGATTERFRRFRVRRNTHDLGFCLVVVLDWSERTRCASFGMFQVILGMPWMTREEEERAPLFGFFAGEEWRCLFDLRLGLLRDWGDGAREAKPWLLYRRRETKFSSTSNVIESEEASWHKTRSRHGPDCLNGKRRNFEKIECLRVITGSKFREEKVGFTPVITAKTFAFTRAIRDH
ncbi:hypothetical protein V8G54_008755 [Vigna mungo]|uniref:Uncharacterized protein n=1 Tax=Vigna mungo TaxID=3915 RepID=A0AAQ3P4Q8_VIGMU